MAEFIPNHVRLRARHGAELLDRIHPGWADEIDLSSLRMDSPCLCVVAQVTKQWFGNGSEQLMVMDSDVGHSDDDLHTWTLDHGFEAYEDEETFYVAGERNEYGELLDAWRVEITMRLSVIGRLL